jgi:carboxyl-terminal processing protease
MILFLVRARLVFPWDVDLFYSTAPAICSLSREEGFRMRVCRMVFIPLLLALVVAAAPVPSPPPSAPPAATTNIYHAPDDSELFSQSLLQVANWVTENYVRPVSRADLLETALTALYESARRPVPRDLRQRINRAEKQAAALTASEANMPAPLVPAVPQPRNPITDDRPLLELLRVLRSDIGRVENLGGADPLRVACQAMLHSLDPYSCVVTSNDDRRTLGGNPQRDGFGLEVPDSEDRRVIVRDVYPGSPAQQAGLLPGDEIVRLRDSDGRPHKLQESLDLLNGRTSLQKPELGALAKPEPIRVTYRRRGKEQTVTIPWRHFRIESVFGVARRPDNSWNYWLDAERKIAHVRLGNLSDGTPDELADILTQLRQDGLRGLILDVRWCPGGALLGSARTAELFLGEGTIATVRSRNQPENVFRSTREGKHNDYPLVVLANGDSIGGAEMIAAALQDHQRAVVVGQRTHGKGNVQSLRPFPSMGLKLTSGTLIRPSGKSLHRFPDSKPEDDWGVRPDPGHEFRISADLSRTLKTWWEKQTMRPGSSNERLPLDDPLTDPQRNAAVEVLGELMKKS